MMTAQTYHPSDDLKALRRFSLTCLICLICTLHNASLLAATPARPVSNTAIRHIPWPTRRGFYLGAEFGQSSVDYRKSLWPSTISNNISNIKTTGFSEHITAGLIINPYIAGELTVNYIAKPSIQFNQSKAKKFKNNIIALLLRTQIAVYKNLYAMAKLGIGYVAREGLNDPQGNRLLVDKEYFRPVYNLGMDWRITAHWDLTASWLQAAGLSSAKLPATNFIGAGFYYRWK